MKFYSEEHAFSTVFRFHGPENPLYLKRNRAELYSRRPAGEKNELTSGGHGAGVDVQKDFPRFAGKEAVWRGSQGDFTSQKRVSKETFKK